MRVKPAALSIGGVRLGPVPRLVLCVTDRRGGRLPPGCTPDLVEARIDLFARRTPAHVERTLRTLRGSGRPIIGTIRTAAEGGRWQEPDQERERLFQVALPLVDAVDVELSSRRIARRVLEAAHRRGCPVIVSKHHLERTPSTAQLASGIDTARRLGADIVKLATHARDLADVATLLRVLLSRPHVPLVLLAMGPVGALSRVFFPAAGSLLTYAFAEGEMPVAPGQLPLGDLQKEIARYYPAYTPRGRRQGRAAKTSFS